MDIKTELYKAIDEELLMLPKESQEVLRSFSWFEIVGEIGRQSNFIEDEITGIQKELALLLVGLTEPDEFRSNLENEVGLSKKEAQKTEDAILEKILKPIAEAIHDKIKTTSLSKTSSIDQNVDFILSGGNYIYLTDSLRKKISKSFDSNTPTQPQPKKPTLTSQFKI